VFACGCLSSASVMPCSIVHGGPLGSLESSEHGSAVTSQKGAESDDEAVDLPPSPCRARGNAQLQMAWSRLKQREEQLFAQESEVKRQHGLLEEQDFELQEERRQHQESILFLARKTSELEARESRVADRERRLSGISGTPGSSAGSPSPNKNLRKHAGATPPRPRSTPPRRHCPSFATTAVQTEVLTLTMPPPPSPVTQQECELPTGAEDTPPQKEMTKKKKGRCRRVCCCGRWLKFFIEALILIGIFTLPQLPRETAQNAVSSLPLPLQNVVHMMVGGREPSVSRDHSVPIHLGTPRCQQVLQTVRAKMLKLQASHMP
jgi:hypothetical protein